VTERPIRVLVVFGGRSAEHEVSVISARSVLGALDPGKYDAVCVGIDKEGRWHLLPGPPPLPAAGPGPTGPADPAPGQPQPATPWGR